MIFLARLVRVLVALLAIRLILRAVAAWMRGRSAAAPAEGPRPAAGPRASDLVRDRVCNTFLPRERALAATVAGRQEFFCSPACRDRALLGAA